MSDSTDTLDPVARPGNPFAIDAGCICPVMDNGHGSVSLARDRGGWAIFSDCPLHGIGGTHPAVVPTQPGSEPMTTEEPRA